LQVAAGDSQAVVVLAIWYPHDKIGHEPLLDGRYSNRGHGILGKRGWNVLTEVVTEGKKT
jgi:hypothetical protein